MQQHDWAGVFPAITTPFGSDGEIDAPALAAHVGWLADAGCRGIVALGSLGEGATLRADEKVRVLQVCREALSGLLPQADARVSRSMVSNSTRGGPGCVASQAPNARRPSSVMA